MSTQTQKSRPILRSPGVLQPPNGTVRRCDPYRGELVRHRVITADGLDYVVVTEQQTSARTPFVTVAYPVARGYLVMVRQPLCAIRSTDERTAFVRHEQLVQVLAHAGVRIVRARRLLEARRRAEYMPAKANSQDRAVDDAILQLMHESAGK